MSGCGVSWPTWAPPPPVPAWLWWPNCAQACATSGRPSWSLFMSNRGAAFVLSAALLWLDCGDSLVLADRSGTDATRAAGGCTSVRGPSLQSTLSWKLWSNTARQCDSQNTARSGR